MTLETLVLLKDLLSQVVLKPYEPEFMGKAERCARAVFELEQAITKQAQVVPVSDNKAS